MYQVVLSGSKVSEVLMAGEDLNPVAGQEYLDVYTQLQKLGHVRTRTQKKGDRVIKTFKPRREVNGKYLDGFALRWKRAKKLVEGGYVHIHEHGDAVSGVVSSQGGPPDGTGYKVTVEFDDGQLSACECGCPDLKKNRRAIKEQGFHAGIPVWNGVIVCKHVLAMAAVAKKGA